MEEMCEQAVEKSKKEFEEETDRHHKALAEHDQAVSEYRAAELETQDERIASLEAGLREVKAKLSDLEDNREANRSSSERQGLARGHSCLGVRLAVLSALSTSQAGYQYRCWIMGQR